MVMMIKSVHLKWLECKMYKYTRTKIQNETIPIMALNVLRNTASSFQIAKFFTLMGDEVTDIAKK